MTSASTISFWVAISVLFIHMSLFYSTSCCYFLFCHLLLFLVLPPTDILDRCDIEYIIFFYDCTNDAMILNLVGLYAIYTDESLAFVICGWLFSSTKVIFQCFRSTWPYHWLSLAFCLGYTALELFVVTYWFDHLSSFYILSYSSRYPRWLGRLDWDWDVRPMLFV